MIRKHLEKFFETFARIYVRPVRRLWASQRRLRDVPPAPPAVRRPVVIEYVQRLPMPPMPTCIVECCREYIAPWPPMLYRGLPCVHCGERPTFKRHDPDSAVVYESMLTPEEPMRRRERIVVRSIP